MTRELVADSGTELALIKLVAAHDLPFQTRRKVLCGVKVNGQPKFCTPDLLFREIRIAVFLDGCYWHRCELHGPLDGAAARIRTKDAAINLGLEAVGWLVLRYWGAREPQWSRRSHRRRCAQPLTA